MCMYVVYVRAVVCGRQKEVLDLQELEFQVVVRGPMWVLGTKPGFSARTEGALNH